MTAEPLGVSAGTAATRAPFWRVLGMFVVAIVVGLVAMMITGAFEGAAGVSQAAFRNAGSAALQGALIAFELGGAAFVLWRLPALTGLSLRELGLRLPRGRDWGVFGYGLLALIGLHILLAVQLVALHQTNHRQAGFESVHAGNRLDVIVTVLGLVVVAPFAEELLFRMTLFRTLAQRLPVGVAAVIASCVFAAFHADAVLFLMLALLGLVLALCYRATNCIVVSMMLHASNNALGAVALLALGTHGR